MNEITEEKSWWSRNWKWAVPTGGCLFIIIAFVVFAGTMMVGLSSLFENSAAHTESLERAAANKEVVAVLGEPIETNGMPQGNVNNINGLKTAFLNIPIKGPNGEAIVKVEGEGKGDNWTYQVMTVTINESNLVIDLLDNEEKLLD